MYGGACLLIVDDNPADVDLLMDGFSELSICVRFIVVSNGEEALALLARVISMEMECPAAVVLDLNMPRVSGRDVLSYIRSMPKLSRLAIIVMTSSSSAKDRDDCLEMGAEAYFSKPSTLDQLSQIVHHIHRFMDPSREIRTSH